MHFIIPQLNFKKGQGQDFSELLKPLLKSTSAEQENFAYFFFQKEDDEDVWWGIESYLKDSSLYKTHLESPEFQKFAETLKQKDLLSSDLAIVDLEPAAGFLTRQGVTSPDGKFIWLVDLTMKSPEARDKALEAAKALTTYVKEEEPTTSSYLFLKDKKDTRRMWVFEMYDDRLSLTEVHHKSEAFLKFGGLLRSEDLVETKRTQGFKTVGLGYLDKDGRHLDF